MQKLVAATPGKAEDRRARRTRERLSWSLVELIGEKGFDAVTVQDLVARAGIGRSTFYSHFRDKDDAFLQHFIGLMQRVGAACVWSPEARMYRLPLQSLCEHMAGNRTLYDKLSRAHRLEPLFRIGRVVLAKALEKRILDEGRSSDALAAAIVAQHLSGALLELVTWWMDRHGACTAAQIDAQFHRLVTPGAAAVLAGG